MVFGVSLGILLLGIYLILVGLAGINPKFASLGKVVPILALVSGILLLLGR